MTVINFLIALQRVLSVISTYVNVLCPSEITSETVKRNFSSEVIIEKFLETIRHKII